MRPSSPVKIAVLIPSYNEEVKVAEVRRIFRREEPQADIHVFDNDSTGRTAQQAIEAEAIVRCKVLGQRRERESVKRRRG